MDISILADRQKIIGEIKGEENKQRKEQSLKAFEIFKSRQKDFIIEKLREEFTENTVKNMRKVTSINLTPRVISEQAAIYRDKPERTFEDASDSEKEQLENLYKLSKANVKFKKSNTYYKLQSQCAIQVIPKKGIIDKRVLMPHHYDVVTDPRDPEDAKVYVINILDKSRLLDSIQAPEKVSKLQGNTTNTNLRDGVDQKIGDAEDFKAELERMVWWSDGWNFTTNGKGFLIDPETDKKVLFLPPEQMVNSLGELPFVDVALMKDFEFWVREINNVVPFTEEFGVLLSDTSDINRLQGYSQCVITSEKPPGQFVLGPHRVIHLPQNPDPGTKDPVFAFETPNPNLNASLELLSVYLRLFLSANNNDPGAISGTVQADKSSSGIDHLLSMIEKFSSSKDDMDLFQDIEQQVFRLMVKWSNLLQGVKGGLELKPELQNGLISDAVTLSVKFAEPAMIQTASEKIDADIKLVTAGMKSKIEAIMEQREIGEDEAKEVLKKIIAEELIMIREMQTKPVDTE